MPRGTPDGRISAYEFAATETDPAAVSNALWGFSPIDGRGRPFFLDTFNNGLGGWFGAAIGAGASAPELYSKYAWDGFIYSPPNAVRMNPGVTAGSMTHLVRTYFLGTNKRLGFETVITQYSTSPDWLFYLDYRVDATLRFTGVLKYSNTAGQWQLQNSAGTFINVFAMPTLPAATVAHIPVKFVGNWETGKYARVLIGDNLIDASTISMPASSLTVNALVSNTLVAYSRGAGSASAFVGYVILTKDEP